MQTLSELIPVLMTVICTEGQHCGSTETKYHPMQSWDDCIQSIQHVQIAIPDSEAEAQFAMMAACVYRQSDKLK